MCLERWGVWGETKFCLCTKKWENTGWCVWRGGCGVWTGMCVGTYIKVCGGLCMDILGGVWETRGVWRDRQGYVHVQKLMCMYLCV